MFPISLSQLPGDGLKYKEFFTDPVLQISRIRLGQSFLKGGITLLTHVGIYGMARGCQGRGIFSQIRLST